MNKLFTSESVGSGHPDKLCDYISDSILDACLALDKKSRVAVETLVKNEFIIVAGEITTRANINIEDVVKNAIINIGYDYEPRILNLIYSQSPDIALGTNEEVGGAGDQGIMFGYANNETEEYFPLAISISHDLIKRAEYLMYTEDKEVDFIKPDMKCQVTVNYSNDIPEIDTVLMSIQTKEGTVIEDAKKLVYEHIVRPVLVKYVDGSYISDYEDIKFLFNPTGKFEIGGPFGDAGITGRKIVVDSYGGYCPVGGGAFSGKDPTKVDRSAAYMARWLAKNIVASGLLSDCLIQLSYAIGVAQPVSLEITTKDTVEDGYCEMLSEKILKYIDLTPKGIISAFDLRRPLYTVWSKNGSFGQSEKLDEKVPWEQIEEEFRSIIKVPTK